MMKLTEPVMNEFLTRKDVSVEDCMQHYSDKIIAALNPCRTDDLIFIAAVLSASGRIISGRLDAAELNFYNELVAEATKGATLITVPSKAKKADKHECG